MVDSLRLMTAKKARKEEAERASNSHGLGPLRAIGGITPTRSFELPGPPMDLEFQHPTDIYSLRPCRNSDAHDLIAIGGEHSVDVLQVVGGSWTRIFEWFH